MTLGAAGDNLVLKIGSYIPFISTFFMPFRAINGYASGLEAWISLCHNGCLQSLRQPLSAACMLV